MHITFTELLVWFIIALLVGVLGETIARRRTPDGIIGATIVGFLAIFLVVGVLGFAIAGEPVVAGVPLISSILIAALLVALWSSFAYRRLAPHYSRYYRRRGSYVRRPRARRRFRLF